MAEKQKQHKVDIFKVFEHINQQDWSYYDQQLDDEQKRALSLYVVMLWMKGAKDNNLIHTVLTNAYVNPFIFQLGHSHPGLVYRLLCAANGGIDNTRYVFKKPPQETSNQVDKQIKTIKEYFNVSHNKAKDLLRLLDETALDHINQLKAQVKE